MAVTRPLEALLARDRWIVGGCLLLLCLLAWFWLLREAGSMAAAPAPAPPAMSGTMAGMDMSGMNMGGMTMPGAAQAPDRAAAWAAAFVMWLVMMVAMMLPSASPMILLYAAFARGVKAQVSALAPTFVFAGVYLLLWAAFSAVAATAQVALVEAKLISADMLKLSDMRLGGGLLALAGLYQLTPLKRACLERCRSPLSFLTRLWRPGWAGAARLGLLHGAYCLGCCWLLMALLFFGGVMNLAWVAALAGLVLVEKVLPIGPYGAKALGIGAVAGGLVMMFWP